MPIFEFKCRNCGHEFEFLKIKSDDHAQCPNCAVKGDGNLEKKVSTGTSFQLKGDNWAQKGKKGY